MLTPKVHWRSLNAAKLLKSTNPYHMGTVVPLVNIEREYSDSPCALTGSFVPWPVFPSLVSQGRNHGGLIPFYPREVVGDLAETNVVT